jgi:hypothetical protein
MIGPGIPYFANLGNSISGAFQLREVLGNTKFTTKCFFKSRFSGTLEPERAGFGRFARLGSSFILLMSIRDIGFCCYCAAWLPNNNKKTP